MKIPFKNIWHVLITPYHQSESGPIVHKERLQSFDMIRGLAIIFMVLIHIFNHYGTTKLNESTAGIIVEFLGGPPTAPVFILIMGLFFMLSSKTNYKQKFIRGMRLFASGFLLNIARGYLPFYFATSFKFISLKEAGNYTPLNLIFTVDILLFAGLSYLAMTLILILFKRPIYWIVTIILIIIVSPFLWGLYTPFIALNIALEFLWGTGFTTSFPLFPWLVFPITGMVLGRIIKQSGFNSRLVRCTVLLGFILFIPATILCIIDMQTYFGSFELLKIGGVISIIGFVLLWHGLFWFLQRKTKYSFPVLSFLSKNITTIYIFHWLLIGWSVFIFGFNTQGLLPCLCLSILVLLISSGLTLLYNVIKNNIARKKKA